MRGFSAVSLLLIDEAAQVEDAMYKALRPMLAVSDGDLWLMSTPYGKRGFFYECWEHGGPEWLRVRRAGDGVSADFERSFWKRSGGRWGGVVRAGVYGGVCG